MGGQSYARASLLGTLLKLTVLVCLILAGSYLSHFIADSLDFELRPSNEDAVHRSTLLAAFLYCVLLAIPFVPGAEIGIALLAMLGPPIALLVYLCTLAGLTLSFTVGRVIPVSALVRMTEQAGLKRTTSLLQKTEPLTQEQRLTALIEKTPSRLWPFLIKYRYLALAVALNVPGNFLIGGGGGIALFAGISRVYSVPGFVATIALAVAPVPLLVTVLGPQIVGR